MSEKKHSFVSFTPKNENLQQYIAYYYFHESYNDDFELEFSFYPNYRHAITVYEKAKIDFSNEGVKAISSNYPSSIFYTQNITHKRQVSLKGKFKKIGIVFEPLAINHFIPKPLANYNCNEGQFLGLGDEFTTLLKELFNLSYEEKITNLDNFFLSRKMTTIHPKLKKAVAILFEEKGGISVTELAEKVAVSRKTLLRQFKLHIGCSVKEYSKLIKFRNAINDYLGQEKELSLTELAYQSYYYDQSHFIHQFKELSQEVPKDLLENLSEFNKFGLFFKVKK